MAARAQQKVQVLFFALGTRGDVQPLAVLADSLKCREPAWALTLVTHAAHKARKQLHALLCALPHTRKKLLCEACQQRRLGWHRSCSTTVWACRRSAARQRAPQSRASGSAALMIARGAAAAGAAARLRPWRSVCGCARRSFGSACRPWWAPPTSPASDAFVWQYHMS